MDHEREMELPEDDSVNEVHPDEHSASKKKQVQLATFKGNGVRPGVDLNNSAALLDLMDRDDASIGLLKPPSQPA